MHRALLLPSALLSLVAAQCQRGAAPTSTPPRAALADASALPPGWIRAHTAAGEVVLPPPFHSPSARNPLQIVARPAGATLRAPSGCTVTDFAVNLRRPRQMAIGPGGEVLVTEADPGRVTVLRDVDGDGVSDRREVFADRIDLPYGIAFHPSGWLYVASTSEVQRFRYGPGAEGGAGRGRRAIGERVVSLPGRGYNQHWTRAIAFSRDGRQLFVSVGSETNVEPESDPRRAAVTVCSWEGADCRVFAAGLRNATALALHPASGALWAVNNERDELGDELVPDFLTSVREGAFYGWPYAYFGPHEDPRRQGERPDLVARTIAPDLSLGAHRAPTGLLFAGAGTLGGSLVGDALVSLHGSWNRAQAVGYHVARVHFSGGVPSSSITPWLDGWMLPDGTVWGRPAGLAESPDGSVLVADDTSNTIFRVHCARAEAQARR